VESHALNPSHPRPRHASPVNAGFLSRRGAASAAGAMLAACPGLLSALQPFSSGVSPYRLVGQRFHVASTSY